MNQQFYIELIRKKLTSSVNEQEIQQLQKWLNESSENRKIYNEFKLGWEKSSEAFAVFEPDIQHAWERVRQKTIDQQQVIPLKKHRIIFVTGKIAAGFILLLGLTVIVKTRYLSPGFTKADIVYTSDNQVKEVQLPDHSKVWLNKNSRITISDEYNKKNRTVLLEGDAYFEVGYDEENPFLVHTNHTITRVVGTAFYIQSGITDHASKIIVESGKVLYMGGKWFRKKCILTKGDQAVYDYDARVMTQQKNDNENYLAWKNGKFVFSDVPVIEVCRQLSQFYQVEIKVEGDPKEIHLTGTFNTRSLEEILEIIEIALDIEFVKSGERYILKF